MHTIFEKISAVFIAAMLSLSGAAPAISPSVPAHDDLESYKNSVTILRQEVSNMKEMMNLGATNAIETPVALFETSLASRILSTDTSMTLVSALTKDGTTLASSTYSFIIDEGTPVEEFVKADCTGTTCTNMERGLSVLTGTTTVTNSRKQHRAGASVKITDAPILLNLTRIINGNGTFPNAISYTSHPTFTSGTQLIDKTYADGLVAAGVATSSESNFGGVWLATLLQQASSTDGSPNKPYVLQSKNSTSTLGANLAAHTNSVNNTFVVVLRNDASIDPQMISTSSASAYNFAGPIGHTGSTTFTGRFTSSATTTVKGNSTTSAAFIINNLAYAFPSSHSNSSSTVLANDGFGNLTWTGRNRIIATSTTQTTLANAATTTAFTTTVLANEMGTGNIISGRIYLSAIAMANGVTLNTCITYNAAIGCFLITNSSGSTLNSSSGFLDFHLIANSANSQTWTMLLDAGNDGVVTGSFQGIHSIVSRTLSADSTANATLKVDMRASTSNVATIESLAVTLSTK